MNTRYDLLKEIKKKQEIVQTSEYCFNKLIQSGDLAKEHYDYNVGFYDISIFYFQLADKNIHYCRVWFGTIDDGDFGSLNSFDTKEEALELLDKIKEEFKDIDKCPSSTELNILFRNIGVYFCLE